MSALGLPELGLPLAYWPAMSMERYAAFEQATGMKLVRMGEIWWQQPRSFLYRPLLPFKKYDLEGVKARFDKIGIFQSAVEDEQPSNSYLNPVLFERPQDYDVKKLRDNVRGSLKKALKSPITVRRMLDEEEFTEIAYPVYLSFYERTKYGFDAGRREKPKFKCWARNVFQFTEVVVLGAFLGRDLVSFEITCLVENTLILKTIVTSDRALRFNTPDLLLHYYRTIAQGQPEIHMIYDSMLSANDGLNNYKIMRGARVAALPAFLHIHPGLRWLIQKANRSAYDRLQGFNNGQLIAKGFVR